MTATIFRLLGKPMPASMSGKPLDVGTRMARFPLSEVTEPIDEDSGDAE